MRVWVVVVVRVCGCTLRPHVLANAAESVRLQDLNAPPGVGGGSIVAVYGSVLSDVLFYYNGGRKERWCDCAMHEVFSCGAVGREVRGA